LRNRLDAGTRECVTAEATKDLVRAESSRIAATVDQVY